MSAAPPAAIAQGLDVSKTLSGVKSGFNRAADQMHQTRKDDAAASASAAAEHERTRDKTRDFCSSAKTDEARYACQGDAYIVKSEQTRQILLGNCFASEISKGLSYICQEGKKACMVLDDSNARYACHQCGGTRQWLATYSAGVIINCY